MNPDHIKLAIAPIIWTNDDMPELGAQNTYEQCISEMALAGFKGCEVGTKFPTNDMTFLKRSLGLRGLQICNQWFDFYLTTKTFEENRKAFERHLDFLEAVGTDVVGGGEMGWSYQGQAVPVFEKKGYLKSNDEWKNFAHSLNELGKIANDRGFKLAFHHHMGTVIQTMAEVDRLLDNTHPSYVYLNYDSGHFRFAGDDPVAALKRNIDRIAHVHLKDVRWHVLNRVKQERLSFLQAVKAGVFTIPGDKEGCIDFPSIFQILDENDYAGWVVVEAEQDPIKANPFEYALKARNYIRQQTGL